MNSQFKLLIYIGILVAIFLLIQDRFNIFDIKIVDKEGQNIEQNEDQTKKEEDGSKEVVNYVELYTSEGKKIKVNVDVADTEASRRAGLSNRQYLGDYDGMLFVFDESVTSSFWMKDMYIPLDIIFFDADGFAVDIKASNEPCTNSYCPAISSSKMYKYVLEVNANFCQDNEVKIGSSMVMHLDSSI
jgi:hypothetical protein